jgi:N-acetylmuramoyl-L-alanine amidase
MRGDDVAELQVRLAQLGFNPGRIDGIFGPTLELALTDFQRNCGLTTNGTLTYATLRELTRMTLSTADRHLVNDARDLAGFDDLPSGPLVLCGASALTTMIADMLSARFDVRNQRGTSDDAVARYANAERASLVLSAQVVDGRKGLHLHYWASYRSHSRQGEQLASALAIALTRLEQLPAVEVTGMALPLMRETTMTTVRIEHEELSDTALHEISIIVVQVLSEIFHK